MPVSPIVEKNKNPMPYNPDPSVDSSDTIGHTILHFITLFHIFLVGYPTVLTVYARSWESSCTLVHSYAILALRHIYYIKGDLDHDYTEPRNYSIQNASCMH